MAKAEGKIFPSVSVTFIPVSTNFTAVKQVYRNESNEEEEVVVGKILANVPKLSGEFEIQIEYLKKKELCDGEGWR